jgi:PAS domain S-box-containing protein
MAGGSAASALLALLAYAAAAAGRRRREGVLVQTRLAAIVESANDAIIGKTLDGVVTSWNRAAETILGYRESDAIGQTVNSLIVPTARQNEETAILASIRRGEAVPHFESLRQHRDGHLIDVSVTVSPIRGEAGAIVGAAKTLRDITHQKANQQRLLELNANLEAEVTARTAELEGARHALQAVLDALPPACSVPAPSSNRLARSKRRCWRSCRSTPRQKRRRHARVSRPGSPSSRSVLPN